MSLVFFDSPEFNKGVRLSSSTKMVSEHRKNVYEKVMENESALRSVARSLGYFSAMDDANPATLGVALKEASLKAYINSIVGYIAVESPMTQMQELKVYTDVVTKSGAKVLPMIGVDAPRTRSEHKATFPMTPAGTTFEFDLVQQITPGSVLITLTLNGATTTVVDDRRGKLLAQGGVLTTGTITYATGKINIVTAVAAILDDNAIINCAFDKTVDLSSGRTKAKQGYYNIAAGVNKFEFEADLIASMITQKTVGTDIVAKLKQSVYDEQILGINNSLVKAITEGYAGNTLTIDLSTFSIAAGLFDSLLRVFISGLVSVDSALAARTYKVIAATAYIVGKGLSDLFESLDADQGWVANTTGYVNGLVGFYKGRAVIRHLDLDDYEGYAIHKTPEGELAPVALGILLPATDLPLVGNFNNTNEVAGGIYSVDGAVPLELELAQKFVLEMPADWMVVE